MAVNKKTLIYVGAGLGTALIGYFIFDLVRTNSQAKKFKSQTPRESTAGNVGSNETGSNFASPSNDKYPLKVGMYGAKVWVLQEALNKLGQNITVDGKFGQQTYSAVQSISNGFGGLNFLCGFDYGCTVTYNNWENIVNKAKEKGLDVNQAWTNAKKKWQL